MGLRGEQRDSRCGSSKLADRAVPGNLALSPRGASVLASVVDPAEQAV